MKKEFIILVVLAGIVLMLIPFTKKAVAPEPLPAAAESEISVRFSEEGKTLGVSLTPIELVEDSRCPLNAVCIQAGTVRVRTRIISALGESAYVLSLGSPIETSTETVELLSVRPSPIAGVAISDTDYEFSFSVAKKHGMEF